MGNQGRPGDQPPEEEYCAVDETVGFGPFQSRNIPTHNTRQSHCDKIGRVWREPFVDAR